MKIRALHDRRRPAEVKYLIETIVERMAVVKEELMFKKLDREAGYIDFMGDMFYHIIYKLETMPRKMMKRKRKR